MTATSQESAVAPDSQGATVVPLARARGWQPGGGNSPAIAAILAAAVLAVSPLASGYYSFTAWAPLTLGAIILLVVVALVARPHLTNTGVVASVGLGLLVALSFASILWAESRDSAWMSSNQIALYAAIFGIGLLAIRELRTARTVMLILGAPALLASVVLAVIFATGGGGNDFLLGRLDVPIGYVNGTAGLLAMGIWPWLSLAEVASSRRVRVAAMTAAGLIAAIAVTTQARALLPAFLIATVLVMIAAPNRTRRGVHLLIVAAAVAVSAHWTLQLYSSTGPVQAFAPPSHTLRGAGLAILVGGLLAAGLKLGLESVTSRVAEVTRLRLSRRLGQTMLIAVAAGAVAIGVGAHGRISTQWNDFTHLNAEQSASNRFLAIGGGFRYDLWRVALDEFKSDPIAGVGAGNYDDSYYRLRDNPQSVTVPHSLEMEVLAELGVLGLVGLLLFCGAVLRGGMARGRRTLAGQDAGLKVAALGMFTAWLAATSVDWLYNIPGLAGMAILAAAILVAPSPAPAPSPSPAPAPVPAAPAQGRGRAGQAMLVVALTLLAFVAASLGRQYVAALYSNSGHGLVSKDPVQALQKLKTAEQLDPWSMQTQYAVASAYAHLNDYGAARDALVHAQQLEPENYVPPALLGDIATRAGDHATAATAYRRALKLDPREPVLQLAVKDAGGSG
jgi:O-Antigen ligase/Tetratricopeptide repeat